jgi:hypothetical protein
MGGLHFFFFETDLNSDPPASASQELGLQVCTTTPGLNSAFQGR